MIKHLFSRTESRRGVALIDLLVAIPVALIIFSIAAAANLSTGQKKSRDLGRKKELKEVAQALESYYQDYQRYPASEDGSFSELNWGTSSATDFGSYLKFLPQDPKEGQTYFYETDADGSSYRLCARLEYDQDPDIQGDYEVTKCQETAEGLSCNYCYSFQGLEPTSLPLSPPPGPDEESGEEEEPEPPAEEPNPDGGQGQGSPSYPWWLILLAILLGIALALAALLFL